MGETPYNDWLGIDRLNKQRLSGQISPEQLAKMEQQCALFNQCFNTASGKKVLRILQDELELQVWDPNKGPNHGYWREGQNDVLNFIINRVKYSRRDTI